MIRPAVVRVIPALDPTSAYEPVCVPTHRDFLHLHRIGEIALRTSRTPGQVQQHEPLGAGDIEVAHPPIEFLSRKPADVAQDETEAMLKRRRAGNHDREEYW